MRGLQWPFINMYACGLTRSIQHIMGHLLSTVHIEIAFTVHFFFSIRRLYDLFWSFKACVLSTPKIDTDVIVFLSSFPTWFIAKLLVLPKALI